MADGPSPAAAPSTRTAAPRRNWRRLRFIPLAIGALAMALGLWTGLARIGVPLPGGTPAIAEFHGALMISGFLGTLISLERAVALGSPWPYAAPALSSLGVLALLAGAPLGGALAFGLAGLVLLLASASIGLRQPALFTVVLAVGAACWGAGTIQWLLASPMPVVTGWWLNFLVLTIAAERLELSRLVRPPLISQVAFAAAALLLLLGGARGELGRPSALLTAAGLIGCAAWLLHHDIARRTIRQAGQPRFSAVCILLGHGWLGVAGVALAASPPGSAAFSYDAAVHAIAIGFVLSMVLGHAPIILPAVTGVRLRLSAWAYAPLALLHASVVLRMAADVLGWVDTRAASAIVTILALVSYAAVLAAASWKGPIGRTT
ncbi:MAG TPA: hypothetical protein VIH40_07700 [Xanthobacteraceae bacterium]